MEDIILDIGNLCVWCRQDTSFGSGKFVNRIPVSTETVTGYGCESCYSNEEGN